MRTGRPREFDRDQAVIKAMHLFWENGYESTSLAQLKAVIGNGITSPSFYAAFGSKANLFSETVDYYLKNHAHVTSSLWDESISPRQALETALLSSAKMQYEPDHPRGCMVALSVMFPCAEGDRQILKPLSESRIHTRNGIKFCIERAIKQGELIDSKETLALAVSYDSFLLGMSLLARDKIPFEDILAGISQIMKLWDYQKIDNNFKSF